MNNEQTIKLRSKMLGAMIRNARMQAGKSMSETAEWLDISPSTLGSYELGRKAASLPELELLSCYFGVPLEPFLSMTPATSPTRKEGIRTQMWVALRQRLIGLNLRQMREKQARSMKDLAEETGFPPSRISAYERGDRPIPLPELDILLTALDGALDELAPDNGTVGRILREQRVAAALAEFPDETLTFLASHDSLTYLQLAMTLKSISADKLKNLTEGLKELTP